MPTLEAKGFRMTSEDYGRSTVRVMHVLGALVPHGAELRTMELLRELHTDRQNVITSAVMVLSASRADMKAELEGMGVSVYELRIRHVLFVWTFLRAILDFRPNVVHSHVNLLSGYILALARIMRVPGRIVHFRNDRVESGRPVRSWLLRALLRFGANHVLAVSPMALWTNWTGVKHTTVPSEFRLSGTDLARFTGTVDERILRESIGVADNGNLIVHVGRDFPVKNRARAISIFEEYSRLDPEAILCFVGSDAETTPRWRNNDPATRIRYVGVRDDVPSILQVASLLLCTSTVEGLPGSVLEALVAGVPVVSSKLPGVEFLSEKIAPVEMMDLSAPDAEWTAAIAGAITPWDQVRRRSTRVPALVGTEFDSAVAHSGFQAVWMGFSQG